MTTKRLGAQTVLLPNAPNIAGAACVGGKKEGEGPLGKKIDVIYNDTTLGEKTWEKSESLMQKETLRRAAENAGIAMENVNYIFAGDLLNQCIGTTFGILDYVRPFFGLYGACSTMAESISLAAMTIDGGFADNAAAMTSSHFCSAERQYRLPLEYGGQRTPTAQWTVTGSGAVVLSANGDGPYVTHVTTGVITDAGITDPNNMGAAMAPAAYETIKAYFTDTNNSINTDLIVTGDLGSVGRALAEELLRRDGLYISVTDCGELIFDAKKQDVHAGGSGCACSALVLCSHLLPLLRDGTHNSILFCGTGALLSPVSSAQGASIPSVCHAVRISNEK
ncbi:MAG: stage V sporulation protein AD [Oscillospiraceae bacterium]|nr:stage V sporulation protein AD [Oscillospiraceae bacterium]